MGTRDASASKNCVAGGGLYIQDYHPPRLRIYVEQYGTAAFGGSGVGGEVAAIREV